MGTPKRVGPPFMAPLAWGASSRAMMGPGNGGPSVGLAMVVLRVLEWSHETIFLRLVTRRRLCCEEGKWWRGSSVQEMCPGLVGQQVGRSTSRSALKVGSAAQLKAAKKEEGPVVWPDPSTPGPDSRFGAGNRRVSRVERPGRGQCALTPDPTQGFSTSGYSPLASDQM